jgi:hypothetical protein
MARGGREPPPRAGRSACLCGRGRGGPDSPHARLHSTCRIGLSRDRGREPLVRRRRAMLTAGRGDSRAAAGAGRDAVARAVAFSDAVTVSSDTAVTVSRATASGVSDAVTVTATASRSAATSATSAASSTFRQRGSDHEGTDGQAEHESAKHCHGRSASFASAMQAHPMMSILDARARETGVTASPAGASASQSGLGEASSVSPETQSRVRV